MERIRILHCLETIGSGGVEQLRYNLAKYLDKDRFEQKIVCTQAIGALPAKMEAQGMQVIPVGLMHSPLHLQRYRTVWKTIRSYRPHIIHSAVFEGISLGTVTGMWGRVPGIIIEETADPVDRSWKGHALMRLYAALSDKVVAESEAAGAYIRSVVKVREPKLQVVNNAAAFPEYPDAAATARLKASMGVLPGEFVVGSTGRLLDSHKKFSDLIKAVAILKEACPGLKLLIVGDGQDRGALEQLAVELGIGERVLFAGYQGDTAPYYACMDVFALASQMEAFGIVLVEAMFFRLPVVATAVGGIPSVIRDGKTGWLVEKNQPAALAERIACLYKDPELRAAFGQAGYERAAKEFAVSVYVERIDRIYSEIAAKKKIGA